MKTKIILFGFMMLGIALSSYCQNQTTGNSRNRIGRDEEVIILDFARGKEMLYAQLHNVDNAAKLQKFSKIISDHITDIRQGKLVIRVNGYCTSYPTIKENLKAAKLRSNQVKSWFITHNGLEEEHFLTFNSALPWEGKGDIVAVAYLEIVGEENSRIPIAVVDNRREKEEPIPVIENEGTGAITTEPVETLPIVAEPEANNQEIQPIYSYDNNSKEFLPRFAVKTNLLYWAGVMPDFKHYTFVPNLEVEWYIDNRWSLAGTGAYAKWDVGNDRFFGVSSWSLEPRFWFKNDGQFKWAYIGLYGQAGDFDRQGYDGNEFGNTGDFYGGGLSLGVVIPLGNRWGVELGLRGGLQYNETDVYSHESDDFYYDFTRTGTKWGVHGIKCSIVYRFGNKQK